MSTNDFRNSTAPPPAVNNDHSLMFLMWCRDCKELLKIYHTKETLYHLELKHPAIDALTSQALIKDVGDFNAKMKFVT